MKLFGYNITKEPVIETRGSVSDPVYWGEFFQKYGQTSHAGQSVTPDKALQLSAVYACIKVLSETIASLPLMLYRKKSYSRDVADTHDLYYLIHDMPNPEQTAFEFFEMVMGHQCLRGNAYVYKEMTEGGVINALYPMNPARMAVIRKPNTGAIVYRYAHEDGKSEDIPSDYIWHMKMYSNDGLVGMSPISYARESIGLGLAAEEYGSLFFSQNAKPSGILEYPGKLTEDSQALLKKSWEESYSGNNAHRTAILQQGLSWKQVGMDNQDAQYLELRQFQIEEICRIFRVPSFLIQHPDKTSTYASAEQQMLAFVMHTIRPWASRIEQSISRCLLTDKERRKMYAEFKIEGLLKGDIKTRYDAYAIARQWGWLSPNDIRKLENLDPLPDGGDIYLSPMNMQDVTKLPEQKSKGDDNGNEPET